MGKLTVQILKGLWVGAFIAMLIFVGCLAFCGCDSLRLAPTEPQKQIAYQAVITARDVESEGTDAHSPAARQLVDATEVSLAYMGVPATPQIEDYPTTLADAGQDAVRRPDLVDVIASADGYFGLAADLAILFGLGGVGFGGKKILDWVAIARRKAKALQEIIDGNEIFKAEAAGKAVEVFLESQKKKQSMSTAQLVGALRAEGKDV